MSSIDVDDVKLKVAIKVKILTETAKQHGWTGNLQSEVIDGVRYTVLTMARNDESVALQYHDNTYYKGDYYLFDKHWHVHCASLVLERLAGWPDLLKLFKWFPNMNRPNLVGVYRQLPFNFEEPNEDIIAKLIGRQLFWYSHEAAKLHVDVVLVPRNATSKNFRIVDVAEGSRKLFHFMGASVGFRSVLLDTVIKVG